MKGDGRENQVVFCGSGENETGNVILRELADCLRRYLKRRKIVTAE